MYISPIKAIEAGWIYYKDREISPEQIQPNGIDVTADAMYMISNEPFYLGISSKAHRPRVPAGLVANVNNKTWVLQASKLYEIDSELQIKLPTNVAAFIQTRSTLARNGVYTFSGLWDSGFEGNLGMTITSLAGLANIEKGSRVAQIVFVEAAASKAYNGSYQSLDGFWADKQ